MTLLLAQVVPLLASGSSGSDTMAVQLIVILGAAALVATLFQRLKLEAIPGYLVAGVLVGPSVLGLVRDSGSVEDIAHIAVVMLMFGIGLHLDVSSMKRGLVHILALGIGTSLVFAMIGAGGLILLGVSPPTATLMGLVFALSSTAVFVRVIAMRRELRSVHARVGLGVNIVQDMLAVVVLAVIPGLARWAGVAANVPHDPTSFDGLPAWLETLLRAGVGLGGVTLMLVVGRYLLPRVLALVARTGSGELMLVCSGALAFGAAGLTTLLGFSAEMGAFLAGFLLASTPFRFQLSGMLAPVRDLLMAVFFVTVGMKVNGATLMQDWWMIGLGAVAVITIKTLVLGVGGWLAGMSAPTALLMAVYLGSAGEFALVAIDSASESGMLSQKAQGDAVGVAIVSLIVLPLLVSPAHRFAARLSRFGLSPLTRSKALREMGGHHGHADGRADGDVGRAHDAGSAHDGAGGDDHGDSAASAAVDAASRRRVIIAGFGPVGRTLADRFATRGIGVTVIELNPRTVQRQASLGRRIVYGDVTNPEVLESAGLREADAVIVTIPDEDSMFRAVTQVRSQAPDVFLAVRVGFLSSAFRAQTLGADHATVEEVATAMTMEREVLAELDRRCPPVPKAE